jgi:hypothetical protein
LIQNHPSQLQNNQHILNLNQQRISRQTENKNHIVNHIENTDIHIQPPPTNSFVNNQSQAVLTENILDMKPLTISIITAKKPTSFSSPVDMVLSTPSPLPLCNIWSIT